MDPAGDGSATAARALEPQRRSGMAIAASGRAAERKREHRASQRGRESAIQAVAAGARRRASYAGAVAGHSTRQRRIDFGGAWLIESAWSILDLAASLDGYGRRSVVDRLREHRQFVVGARGRAAER